MSSRWGTGRKYMPHLPPGVAGFMSGRQLSPIYTYQSGPPIGFGNAIVTCPLSQIPNNGVDNNQKVGEWFNTSCFNRNSAQQLADNLITLSPRFSGIRADAYNSWDMALMKDTAIRENMALELRTEALQIPARPAHLSGR
jgi:hypothetical protein